MSCSTCGNSPRGPQNNRGAPTFGVIPLSRRQALCLAMTWLSLVASLCLAEDLANKKLVKVTVHLKDLSEETLKLKTEAVPMDVLEVRLEKKAVGYLWQVGEHNPQQFELISSKSENPSESKPGKSSYQVYRFRVLQSGELNFEWKRPFGESDVRQVNLTVRCLDKESSD